MLFFQNRGTQVADLEKNLNDHESLYLFTRVTVKGQTEIIREMAPTRNVVMLLPGEDRKA